MVQGIVLDDGPTKAAPEKFVAAKYSSGKVVINNLFHNIFPVIDSEWFLTFFYLKDFCGGNDVCAKCSSSLLFMVSCRIKKQLCFHVPCL